MPKIRKKYVIYSITAIIVAFSFFMVRGCGKKSVVSYTYADVSFGSVEKTISVSGKLELFDIYTVVSKIGGFVGKVNVSFNEVVKKNQVLSEIDSVDTDEAFEAYKDTYKFAKIDVINTKEMLKTKELLFDEKLISQFEINAAKLQYDKVVSTYTMVQKEYKKRLDNVEYKKILSPTAGIVIQSWATERLPVGPGTQLFLITPSLEKMKLIINIDESDIGFVKIGQEVLFSVSAYPEKEFKGNIEEIRMNPILRDGIVAYESLVVCKNENSLLRPGMTASATVNIAKKDNVLKIPNQAYVVSPLDIQIKRGQRFVWKKKLVSVGDLPMEKIEVKLGLIGDTYSEVIEGKIEDGDEVLISITKKTEI